jgi:hypothetical protein
MLVLFFPMQVRVIKNEIFKCLLIFLCFNLNLDIVVSLFYFKFGDINFILFVSTRRQFISVVEDCAINCNAHYVTQRWLGGMLTNWFTIKTCIDNLQSFCVF